MSEALNRLWNHPLGFVDKIGKPKQWSEDAIQLKQSLMISPKDYGIHFCKPSTLFDASWMQAEDFDSCRVSDEHAEGKKILTCLFPALVQMDPDPFTEDTTCEEILTRNKKFAQTMQFKGNFDPRTVLCKAAVLVKRD